MVTHLTDSYGDYSISTCITLCSKEVHKSYLAAPDKATCEHCLKIHKNLKEEE